MKPIMLALAGALLCLTTTAQPRIGIQAGATFSDLKLSDVSRAHDLLSNKTGFLIGATCDVRLFGPLGLNTGLLFVQRNVKEVDSRVGGSGGMDYSTIEFSSLELPVNLKVAIKLPVVTPFLIGGPYADWLISAKNANIKLSSGSQTHTFNYGVTLGAGIDIVKTVRVMYQYDWGLSSLTNYNIDVKTRSQRICVAVLF